MARPKKTQDRPELELAVDQENISSQSDLSEIVSRAGSSAQEEEVSFDELTKLVANNSLDPFIRNDDGKVNWRKMVKPEYVVVNNQYKDEVEKKNQKPLTEIPIEQLEDKYLLILLAGIKELAELRGYSSVDYHIVTANSDYVGMKCTINWNGFEDQAAVSFSSTADASPQNTTGFARDFLMATAENRSFVRCVRNFLKIHITGRDELGSPQKVVGNDDEEKITPLQSLINKVERGGRKFDQFREWWVTQGNPEAQEWKSWESVPPKDVWSILGVLKQLEEERKKAKGK